MAARGRRRVDGGWTGAGVGEGPSRSWEVSVDSSAEGISDTNGDLTGSQSTE